MTWTQLSSGSSGISTSGSSMVYNLPGGTPPAGVLEVFCTGGQTSLAPSGGGGAAWTQLQTYNHGGGITAQLYYRITNGSEGSSVNLAVGGGGGGLSVSVQFQRWSGQAAAYALDTSNVAGVVGSLTQTPALATGTLAGPGELVLEFGQILGAQTGPPTAPVWTDTGATDSGNGPAYLTGVSSQADGSYAAYHVNPATSGVTAQVAFSSWTVTDAVSFFVAFKPPGLWKQLASNGSVFLNAGSSSFTYTLPGGAPPAGVLEVICHIGNENVTAISAGGGAAWTNIQSFSASCGTGLWYRITNGSEGTTVGFTLQTSTSGNAHSVQFQRWSGQAAVSPLDKSNVLGATAGGQTGTLALATGALAGGDLLLEFAGGFNLVNTAQSPSAPTWTDTGAADTGQGPALEPTSAPAGAASVISYCAYNINPATSGVTAQAAWTGYTATNTVSYFIAFLPAPVPAGPPLTPGNMGGAPAVVVSGAGWRGANHSR